MIFLKESKIAFKKPSASQNGGSWTLLLPSLCVERLNGRFDHPETYVCSNIGVNCLHCGSDNNPTVGWFVDALQTSVINDLAHTDQHNRNC